MFLFHFCGLVVLIVSVFHLNGSNASTSAVMRCDNRHTPALWFYPKIVAKTPYTTKHSCRDL